MRIEKSSGIVVYKWSGKEEKYLLLVRHNGNLDFPKGHVERGETEIAAALRETLEECNCAPALVFGFMEKTDYSFYIGKEKIHKYLTMFLGESNDSSIRISHEHAGYKWLSFSDAMKRIKYENSRAIIKKAHEYIEKAKLIKGINQKYSLLPQSCKSWDLSKNFVPGEGSLNAEVMFVGQAPGQNEDMQRRPFVGRSGKLLDRLSREANLSRSGVYITNVVQFFPPKNRAPTLKEMELCKPLLVEQIKVIKPKIIVMLGRIAATALLGSADINKNHGKIVKKDGIMYFLTFHPSAALRFPPLQKTMQEDFKKLREAI